MKKIIFLSLTISTTSVFANGVEQGPVLEGADGTHLTMVKECFRHEVLYETHPYVDGGSYAPCSFPLDFTPGLMHRHVPDDPQCFSEHVIPVPIQ